MARSALLGIDVGTSALKGVLLGDDGRVIATATADYPLATPHPGWSEQSPEDWWRGCQQVCRELSRHTDVEVMGVGLSGQMHGSTFLDRNGAVIRPALLWNDARTGAQCAEIERRIGRERLVRITGNRASAGFQAPKLLWLQAEEPDAFARLACLLLPKDFVRFRMTGELASDPADASGTLLFDLAARRWSDELIDALEVRREWLPDIHESADVTGRITPEAAALTGLPAGTPVIAGGGDNACAAVGAGIIHAGQGVLSLGTSGTIFVHGNAPMIDPDGALNAFCACTPDGWHSMGVILSAGGALRWYRDAVREGSVGFDALLEEAAMVEAGAGGVRFLPYLAGERSPHLDPDARAAWVGLSLAHDRRHMTRALLEGVGFAFADCLDRMRALKADPPSLVLVGGGAGSATWCQLLAAQLGVALETRAAQEGPALGAALLAGVGTGVWQGLDQAVAATVPSDGRATSPDQDLAGRYRDLHRDWARLYPALKTTLC
jgi:xylulokinase